MIAFETETKNVAVGDQVISPLGSKRVIVREVKPAMHGLLLVCMDGEGQQHLIVLDPEAKIKVVDA